MYQNFWALLLVGLPLAILALGFRTGYHLVMRGSARSSIS